MHRFYLPPEECQGTVLTLSEREAHHAAQVLRLVRGSPITVLDGEGHTIEAQVTEVSRKYLNASVVKRRTTPLPACRLTLVQAIPKGKLMDAIIQKATELGVSEVVPLMTERVVSHLDSESGAHKEERWQQTAVEAIKQCGTPWLPRIHPPRELSRVTQNPPAADLALVGSLRADARHPRVFFDRFRDQHGKFPASISLWVGPEGDFTDHELEQIRDAGAQPITLGPLVLRVETAAIYCLALANYESQAAHGS
jgi:16S rRNA (uracil1498-N3)-methyltransferase